MRRKKDLGEYIGYGVHLFTILHKHRWGVAIYLARGDHKPSEEEVIKLFNIELGKKDYIDINLAGPICAIPPREYKYTGEPITRTTDAAILKILK